MSKKSVREMLLAEAAEAEAVAEMEDGGEAPAQPVQRARRQAADPSQVYSVRIPVDRLEQLRRLADTRGVAPTALVRQFVLEALDRESALDELKQAHFDFVFTEEEPRIIEEPSAPRAPAVNLGPRRQQAAAPVRRDSVVARRVAQ